LINRRRRSNTGCSARRHARGFHQLSGDFQITVLFAQAVEFIFKDIREAPEEDQRRM
jgi:hypothetical protein